MQGVENILAGMSTGAPVIGLIKKVYEGSEVYITPTQAEVDLLLGTQCPVIALDGTLRKRPGGVTFDHLVSLVHGEKRLVMADCDCAESIVAAVEAGADIVSTTLSGYTEASSGRGPGPDLELVRWAARHTSIPVLAEGRMTEPWQARAALLSGASGVVIGGSINDPVKQTMRFSSAMKPVRSAVGAVDIGGTWLRCAIVSPSGEILRSERIAQPSLHKDRVEFVRSFFAEQEITRVGVSAGGVIDANSATVTEAKTFIPDYVGKSFAEFGREVFALNDGLATAWGHACRPEFAGLKVASLAVGSGVGAGVASVTGIETDVRFDYPRLNDLPFGGGTVETVLGGLQLGESPSEDVRRVALEAGRFAVEVLKSGFPDRLVICGGVGLSDWFWEEISSAYPEVVRSPFEANAGLMGAAALAQWPPANLWPAHS